MVPIIAFHKVKRMIKNIDIININKIKTILHKVVIHILLFTFIIKNNRVRLFYYFSFQ